MDRALIIVIRQFARMDGVVDQLRRVMHAVLEGGTRTSTMRAVTKCRIAVAPGDQLDRTVLEEISGGHRREHDHE